MTDLTITQIVEYPLNIQQRDNLSKAPRERTRHLNISVDTINSTGQTRKKTFELMVYSKYNSIEKFEGVGVSEVVRNAKSDKDYTVFEMMASKQYGFIIHTINKKFRSDVIGKAIETIVSKEWGFEAVDLCFFPIEFGVCAYCFSHSNRVEVSNDDHTVDKISTITDELKIESVKWISQTTPAKLRLLAKSNREMITSSGQEVIDIQSTTVQPVQLVAEDMGEAGSIASVELKDYNSMNRTQLQEYCSELSVEFTQRHTAKELKDLIAAKLNPVTEQVTVNA